MTVITMLGSNHHKFSWYFAPTELSIISADRSQNFSHEIEYICKSKSL